VKKFLLICLISLLNFSLAGCGDPETGESETCLFSFLCSHPETEICGDGILDFSESCDGFDIGGKTCGDIPALGKYSGGFLGCTDQCLLDTSACDPCWGYPCAPTSGYGRLSGEIIEDNAFAVGNDASGEYGIRNGSPLEFALSHVYKEGSSKGGRWKGALIFVTTGWCPYCQSEAKLLEEKYQHYKSQGILFIAVIAQDAAGAPATAEYARTYSTPYGWTFPAVAGEFPLKYWPDQVGYPLNMLVNLENMEIIQSNSGALMSRGDVDNYLGQLLTAVGQ